MDVTVIVDADGKIFEYKFTECKISHKASFRERPSDDFTYMHREYADDFEMTITGKRLF